MVKKYLTNVLVAIAFLCMSAVTIESITLRSKEQIIIVEKDITSLKIAIESKYGQGYRVVGMVGQTNITLSTMNYQRETIMVIMER